MNERLTPAELIRNHQREIIDQWLSDVLAHLPAARHHGLAELTDHLLDLLNDVVHTLEDLGPDAHPDDVDKLGFVGPTPARHGRERASLTHFTVGDVVHEYILFRHLLTGFCSRHLPGDLYAVDVINRVIEYSALDAVNEFTRAIEEVQQKLIATLVHDVRTPLGVAFNYAELLEAEGTPPHLHDQAVKTVMRNVRRSVSMLEELLDAVKVKAGGGLLMRFEEDDLARALRVVCMEADQIYQRRIESDIPSHPVVGVFDMAMVVRTVENLVSNAAKFGDKQGRIRIIMEDGDEDVRVCVQNSGIPIPEEDKERIFQFFTSPSNGRGNKGWGLGLSLIKSVAQSHGGEVIFDSSETHGTTFGMSLCKRRRRQGEELTMLL